MLLFYNLSMHCLSEIYTVHMEKNGRERKILPASVASLPSTTLVSDTHAHEINKHNCTLANKLYNKF